MCRINTYLIEPLFCSVDYQLPLGWVSKIKAPDPETALKFFYNRCIQFDGVPCAVKQQPEKQP